MPARLPSIPLEPEAQRLLGVALFNYVWTLLEREDRTVRETERMVDAAHASRLFWEVAGEPVNWAREAAEHICAAEDRELVLRDLASLGLGA